MLPGERLVEVEGGWEMKKVCEKEKESEGRTKSPRSRSVEELPRKKACPVVGILPSWRPTPGTIISGGTGSESS